MVNASMPEDGDVVVRPDGRGASIFVLATIAGPAQLTSPTREDALRQARSFAKKSGVRVWLQNGAAALVLVDDFRPRPPAGEV